MTFSRNSQPTMTVYRTFAILCLLASSGGCFTVTDFKKFRGREATGGAGGSSRDQEPIAESGRLFDNLDFTLDRFIPHTGHFFEYRIVSDKNIVMARGCIDATPQSGSVHLYVPNTIPTAADPTLSERTFRFDMFAAVDNSRIYASLGPFGSLAHAWRIPQVRDFPVPNPLSDDDGIVKIFYRHNSNYDDINAVNGVVEPPLELGGQLTLHVTGAAALRDKMFELHVVDKDSRQVIGFFVNLRVSKELFDVILPHYVDYTTDYELEVYSDVDNNQTVNAGDQGWMLTGKSTIAGPNAGLELTFNPVVNKDDAFEISSAQGRTGP